jgi:hypothetical protein
MLPRPLVLLLAWGMPSMDWMFPRRGLGAKNLSGDVNPREKIMPNLEQITFSLEKLSKYRQSILSQADLTPDGSNIPIHETFMDSPLTQRRKSCLM